MPFTECASHLILKPPCTKIRVKPIEIKLSERKVLESGYNEGNMLHHYETKK